MNWKWSTSCYKSWIYRPAFFCVSVPEVSWWWQLSDVRWLSLCRPLDRRQLLSLTASGTAGIALAQESPESGLLDQWLSKRLILSSCMFGNGRTTDIMPEVARTGASVIDIWPKGISESKFGPWGESSPPVYRIGMLLRLVALLNTL